jgi:replicative DNA helicase
MTGVSDALQDTLDQLEALYGSDGEITGVETGYVDLDSMLLGLQPSNLLVVAARPGAGKTSFAMGAAANVAMSARRPVMFFSMEMGTLELTKRLLSGEARVELRKLQTGKIREDEWTRLSHAVGRLAETPLLIDDNPHCTVMEMRAKARRTKARYGDLGLVVVDYLQLMSPSSTRRTENRQVEVAEISRGLKILARELDCPVMALSQLNRQREYRQDKRPMLADLRESGSLEQDSDVVIFLYRDEIYNPESDQRGTAEIIVSKHRNGPTGVTRLAFLDHFTKFANMARDT